MVDSVMAKPDHRRCDRCRPAPSPVRPDRCLLRRVARDLQTIAKALIDGAAAAGETNLPALRKRLERAALAYLVSG